jgi:predicted dehydrogenase
MRIGVIGAGRWGRNIIRTLRGMPDAVVACVASRNPATRDVVAADCAIEPDWRRLLRRSDLDAVAIATPPAVHVEMAAEAVAAGLPVFVEKPLTCSLPEAERLFDLAAAHGGYVLVDHVHLFGPAYRALRARLGGLGPVTRVDGDAGAWGPFRTDTPVLWDWGPHDAAFCVDLLRGSPESVRAQRRERRAVEGAWGETLSLHAGYENGAAAGIRLSNLLESKRRRLRVEGPGGALIYDDHAPHKLVFVSTGASGVEPIEVAATPPLESALSHFIAAVSAGRRSLDDLRFGVEVVGLLARWDACLGTR